MNDVLATYTEQRNVLRDSHRPPSERRYSRQTVVSLSLTNKHTILYIIGCLVELRMQRVRWFEVEILGGVRPNSATSTDFHRFPLDVAEHHCDYCQNMRGSSMKRRSVSIPSQIWREPPTTTAGHRRTPVVVGVC